MKKNKKGFLLTLAALTLSAGIGVNGVNAATVGATFENNPDISADCGSNTIYTNYYYFVDAVAKSYVEGTSWPLINGLPDYQTTGVWRSETPMIHSGFGENINFKAYDTKKYAAVLGRVNVGTTTAKGSNGAYSTISINDFYNNFVTHASNKRYESGNDLHLLGHTYWVTKADGGSTDGNVWGVPFASQTVQNLINASIKLNKEPLLELADRWKSDDNQFDSKNNYIKISRNYTNSTAFSGQALSTLTAITVTDSPDQNGNGNWFLQPSMAYIQYCKLGAETPTPETKKITLTYDYNYDSKGTYKTDSKENVTDKAKFTIISEKPNRTGHTFKGWATTKEGSVKYTAGNTYEIDSDKTLYAVWEEVKGGTDTPSDPGKSSYTVTYDANGGTDAPKPQTKDAKTCINLSKDTPKQTGNTFLGWSTDKNAKEADSNYKSGAEYCTDADLTLYAVWQTKTGLSDYVVAFGIVALAAGAGLYVAKKKNLFKQL